MTDSELLSRITIDPAILAGKPIIRGRRLAVEHVLGMLAAGDAQEDILRAYPWLEPDDIRACLAYSERGVVEEPTSEDSSFDPEHHRQILEILSRRHDTGITDLAERHNEHQP